MKLISWNVNGFRACMTKGFMDFFDEIDADYTLWNDTTLENLVLNVDSLVRLLRANGKI